ncbi:poly(rC)-binding protein 3-like isoform X2 [Mercenaria mercenaria]|uniref:poly(rC)-binding protein 3-like isoform X2 n=1 Tax=Mercenaria mercenaria TaxID=6596 RepID=UPI001E1D4BD4|nr:poly(rC)-binding protein 3-like isoform X2 [Mercenaria mercenaria]
MATEKTMVQGSESNGIAPSILTVRMIMQGKEVGSIIGKKGDNIKKYREDSGAKINISDGSCPERIVTITGTTENIHKAFTMICSKFEEDLQNTPTVPKPPVTLRLVVPASQCGSLIGKGGIKIKEIRESTGASIQVASEMLPNSTERAVTVSGTAEAVTACIKVVCNIMLESPPKGATIPYRPKPAVPPVVYAGGQAFVIQSPQMPVPPPAEFGPVKMMDSMYDSRLYAMKQQVWCNCPQEPYGYTLNKLNQMSLGQPVPMLPPTAYLPVSAAPGYAPIPFQQRHIQNGPIPTPNGQQTHEMNIPNDLIGCIIGRGGQKINEIRQISGANIKISNAEEGCPDRKVTITGTPETIGMAQYLINTSMELHKTLVLDPNSAATSPTSSVSPTSASPVTSMAPPTVSHQATPVAMPLTIPAMKPLQFVGMNGLSTLPANLSSFNGINGINGLNFQFMDPLLMAGGVPQPGPQPASNFTGKVRLGMAAVKTGSPKFAPY